MKCRQLILVILVASIVVSTSVGAIGGNGNLSQSSSLTLNSKLPPGGNFDLSIWSLQMPIGSGSSPKTVAPTQLAGVNGFTDSNYFYTNKTDGAMIFMDPATGITTAKSLHCRTELREIANWAATGTNTMAVTGELVQVGGGSDGHVTIGQVFDYSTGKPLCELEYYNDGTFRLLLEKTSAGGSADFYTLGAQFIGNQYTFSLSLTGAILTVTVNGAKTTYTPDKSFNGAQYYFKCGAYDQSAIKGIPSITPYTIVKVYSVNVQHSNTVQIMTKNSPRLFKRQISNMKKPNTNSDVSRINIQGRTIQHFSTSFQF